MIMVVAAAIALLLSATVLLLLRGFSTTCLSYLESFDRTDISWRTYPIHRLLNPEEFEFLRRRGIPESQIRKVRAERRKIYRLCLRSLARDFNRVYMSLKIAMVQSSEDRPDLAAFLATQKIAFYRNILLMEGWLALHALGVDRMPAIDLSLPLKTMQSQWQALARPVAMGAAAA